MKRLTPNQHSLGQTPASVFWGAWGVAGGALGPPCLTSKGKCDGLEPQASTGFRGKGGSAVVATSEAEIPEDEDSALPSEAKQQFRLCS